MVATIKSLFTEVYGVDSGGAQFGSVDIDVGNIKHGQPTTMNLQIGGPGILVYPVTAKVEIDVHYSNNPSVLHFKRGVKSDDVFLFYKDAFGHLTCKTGACRRTWLAGGVARTEA